MDDECYFGALAGGVSRLSVLPAEGLSASEFSEEPHAAAERAIPIAIMNAANLLIIIVILSFCLVRSSELRCPLRGHMPIRALCIDAETHNSDIFSLSTAAEWP